MVSSEAVPYAKAGGLGDMVSALAVELARQDHDVRVVLPRYYGIDKGALELMPGPLGVPVGFGTQWCGVYRSTLPGSEVPVYFLDHERLFGRDGIYGSKAVPDFPDNPERFALLSRGAFQLAKRLEWIPDIMHAHDWPTALVPVFLRTWESSGPFASTASVLTIHNLGYQGIYPKDTIVFTQLSWDQFHGSGFEWHDTLNLLKAGLSNADILSTVSPTYAAEIQTSNFGFGLDGLLRRRGADLFGVLNGIDYTVWSPDTDHKIPHRFDDRRLAGKAANKKELQRRLGLAVDAKAPLVGMVTRLVDQKGVGALAGPSFGSLWGMCTDFAVQFAILGSGDAWCETELTSLAARLPNLAVQIGYDDGLAHLIEAGADFFLMPSAYEPCGLNQMYSLRYGTLPIVRRTGGLADTVEQYVEATGEGTGFLFEQLTPRAIYDTVGWAVWTWFNRREHVTAMRRRAMRQRFSWDGSARRYGELYQWALDRRLGRSPHAW
jgi:starch synthase